MKYTFIKMIMKHLELYVFRMRRMFLRLIKTWDLLYNFMHTQNFKTISTPENFYYSSVKHAC